MSLNVGKVGFGLMGMTWNPESNVSQEEFNRVFKSVLDNRGYEEPLFVNSGEFYGIPDRHANLKLLGGFFEKYRHYADEIYLSVKAGVDDHWAPDTSAERLQSSIEAIEKYLQPLFAARKKLPARLDMFTLARKGFTSFEETLAILDKYRKNGAFESLCLSEIGAKTIEEAVKITKVDAVEIEYSLFVQDAAKNGVFEVLKKHNIPAIAYSPLGKGLLAGQNPSDLNKSDMRNHFDGYQKENWEHNQKLVAEVKKLATSLHASLGQIAISYIVAQSNTAGFPKIIPIPGSTKDHRQLENMKVVDIPASSLKELQSFVDGFERKGGRYNSQFDAVNWA